MIAKETLRPDGLLKSVNNFVIFCNFPIDEMEIMGYNACMKSAGARVSNRLPRLADYGDLEDRQIISNNSLGGKKNESSM